MTESPAKRQRGNKGPAGGHPENKRRKADLAALTIRDAELSERHPRENVELREKYEQDCARLREKYEQDCPQLREKQERERAELADTVDSTRQKVYATCSVCEEAVVDEQVDKGCVKCDPPVPVCRDCIKDYRQCSGCDGKICEDCRYEREDMWTCYDCDKTFCKSDCGDKQTCVVCRIPCCFNCPDGCAIGECNEGLYEGGYTCKECCWRECETEGLICEKCAADHLPADITVDNGPDNSDCRCRNYAEECNANTPYDPITRR
jgi:hypothetical protein